MICPHCGEANPEDNKFCKNCGRALGDLPDTTILPPPPGEGPAPATPYSTGPGTGSVEDIGPPLPVGSFDRPSAPSHLAEALTKGWGTAMGSAGLTFLIMLLIGEGLAALVYAAAGSSAPSIDQLARIGGLFTYSFHRVGVVATFPRFPVPGTGSAPVANLKLTIVVAVSMLLGTALLVWLLYRAGRSLGRAAGGTPWIRGLSGARVALPYALITGIGAVLLALAPLSFPIPEIPGLFAGGTVELAPSVIAAFLWPLGIAAVAAFAGGVASSPREAWNRPRVESLAVGAMRGGMVMLGWGVVLGFLGFEVFAFTQSGSAVPFNPEFFNSLLDQGGGLQAATTVVFLLMFVPNIGAMMLAPAMGSSLVAAGNGISITFLSYLKFPAGFDTSAILGLSGLGTGDVPGDIIQTRVAPAAYWLFLLVPLTATVLGGRSAAKRAAAGSAGEGAAAGAMAGVVYAGLVTAVAVMSGLGIRTDSAFSGISTSSSGHLGAALGLTALAGLAWGVVGGAIGGLWGGRSDAPATAAVATPAYGFEGTAGSLPPPEPRSDEAPGQGVETPPPMTMPPAEDEAPPPEDE